jgi:hypothetical protein
MKGPIINLKLHGIISTPTNEPISAGVLPFMAIHAGKPKYRMPSGIPCAKYRAEKLKYRSTLLLDNVGR